MEISLLIKAVPSLIFLFLFLNAKGILKFIRFRSEEKRARLANIYLLLIGLNIIMIFSGILIEKKGGGMERPSDLPKVQIKSAG